MNDIQAFYEAAAHPEAQAARIKSKSPEKRIIGHVCSYAPEELIYAAGCHPVRIFPGKERATGLSDTHLQSYCCSLVRGILEQCLSGRLNFLDGIIFPHTCDSMMRLSDIVRLNGQTAFFSDVILPAKLHTDSASDYLKAVLERFCKNLESHTGRVITEADLKGAVRLFNAIRKNLSRLYELTAQTPGVMSGKDLWAIVQGAMIMERGELLKRLESIVSTIEQAKGMPFDGPRLILSGSVCTTPEIYGLIEDSGAAVVADDLCTGQRWFDGQINETLPPLEALTRRYTRRLICPAKYAGTLARAEQLVVMVKQQNADGVVFLVYKFCDPHAFDMPYLKEVLDEAGIKNQVIEIDEGQQSTGQTATRLETFIQML